MISGKHEIERETALVDMLKPRNFHVDGDSDGDQEDRTSESESHFSEQWYELDGQDLEALMSLRDARKKLQRRSQEDSTQQAVAVPGAQENPSMS